MEQNSSSPVLGGGGTVGMSDCDCTNSRVNNKANTTPITNVNTIEIDWEAIANKQQQYIDKLMMAQRNKEEEERQQIGKSTRLNSSHASKSRMPSSA